MIEEFAKRLETDDQATLTPLVRRMLQDDGLAILDWHYQPVEGSFGQSYIALRWRGSPQLDRQPVIPLARILPCYTHNQDPTGQPVPGRYNLSKRSQFDVIQKIKRAAK
jgi:hypothetical protein